MDFLNWAEMSPLGMWVSTSLWGYPIALTLHTIGMGTLVGLALMICIRLLGLGKGIQTASLVVYWKLALVGFIVNFLSGTALFFGSATVLWESWPFRIKVACIAMGLLATHALVRCVKEQPEASEKHKCLSVLLIVVWIAALIAGRLIAYIF